MPGGANLGVPALRVPQLFDRQAHKRTPSILFDGGTRYDKLTTKRQRGWAVLQRNVNLLRNIALASLFFVRLVLRMQRCRPSHGQSGATDQNSEHLS